jgi:hypothetical protein
MEDEICFWDPSSSAENQEDGCGSEEEKGWRFKGQHLSCVLGLKPLARLRTSESIPTKPMTIPAICPGCRPLLLLKIGSGVFVVVTDEVSTRPGVSRPESPREW